MTKVNEAVSMELRTETSIPRVSNVDPPDVNKLVDTKKAMKPEEDSNGRTAMSGEKKTQSNEARQIPS
jgi:hypothetical protein